MHFLPGGGPPAPKLDPLDELVADILGMENFTIDGMAGAQDIVLDILNDGDRYGVIVLTRTFPTYFKVSLL